MSLWNKPVGDMTFEDVALFCQQKHREGPRLDYKRDWPDDLERLVCAFANTLGGIIVMGVESDGQNEPIWPPHGLSNPAGIADRIVQKSQDAIYPPVRPSISRVLTDPASGKSCIVVRVDPSPEAPHAVEMGRKVYERTDSINKPWALAHVDRIQHLLDRRRRHEQDREEYIQMAIARGRRYLNAPAPAVRWASIIPLFPWHQLCDPELCYTRHLASLAPQRQVQRFPDGSFALDDIRAPSVMASVTAHGHVFMMEYPDESRANDVANRIGVNPNDFLGFTQTVVLVNRLIGLAKELFEHPAVEHAGLMQFNVGFLNAFGKQMWLEEAQRVGRPFPNVEFRAPVVFPVEALIQGNVANEQQLFHQIKHGFDLFDSAPRPSA